MANDTRPAYRAVADRLRAAIMGGVYGPGIDLPGDKALAAEHQTNRSTVGQAVRLLLAEGYLIKKGRNYAVSPLLHKIRRDANARYTKAFREKTNDGAPARGAFDSEVRSLGMTPKSEVTVDRVVPSARIAEALGVSAETASVVARARRMLADETPVQVAISYIPGDIAFGTVLEEADTGAGGMVSRLADLGLAQASVTEEIDVRTPTAEEISALGLTEDSRVYEILHVAKTADGKPVEATVHVMPTHQWTLRYGWDIEPRS